MSDSVIAPERRHEQGPAWPDLLPGPALVGLAARLSPESPTGTASLAERLSNRLAQRIAQSVHDLMSSQLDGFESSILTALSTRPAAGADGLAAAIRGLDPAAALALLDESEGNALAGLLLQAPQPDLREAALDQLSGSGAVLSTSRLASLCRMAAAARLEDGIGHSALAPQQRLTLHDRLATEPAIATRTDSAGGEVAFLAAIRQGNHPCAIRLLSTASTISVPAIEGVIADGDCRALVSLAWRAGFSMQSAVLLQVQLAAVEPDRVLVATADGACPMGRAEMAWQLVQLSPPPGPSN